MQWFSAFAKHFSTFQSKEKVRDWNDAEGGPLEVRKSIGDMGQTLGVYIFYGSKPDSILEADGSAVPSRYI
jgi:hypothetical protein